MYFFFHFSLGERDKVVIKQSKGTDEDRSDRWTVRQTGGRAKQEKKKKKDRQTAKTDEETNRHHVTVCLFVPSPQTHIHTPVPPAFQIQRERTEPDKHTDKHQPD